jgi:hypothetical protein
LIDGVTYATGVVDELALVVLVLVEGVPFLMDIFEVDVKANGWRGKEGLVVTTLS